MHKSWRRPVRRRRRRRPNWRRRRRHSGVLKLWLRKASLMHRRTIFIRGHRRRCIFPQIGGRIKTTRILNSRIPGDTDRSVGPDPIKLIGESEIAVRFPVGRPDLVVNEAEGFRGFEELGKRDSDFSDGPIGEEDTGVMA